MLAAVPADALEAVRALAPPGVDVRALPGERDHLAETLAGAAFLLAPWDRPDVLELLPSLAALRVVQVLSAGTEWIEPHLPPGVTLCNARGARDIPVAEWVVGALLGVATGLFDAVRRQADRRWEGVPSTELAGTRVVILGMGSIGEAVRRRLETLRVEVVGVARHERRGVEPVGALPALLPTADAVVVLLPLGDATRGLVDAAFLARMRDGALLLNAGRGPVVDTEALTAEVASGRLRAVLDVVDPEPLPLEHPLWGLPGAYISPHVAGDSRAADLRAQLLAGEQLRRFARGEPLRNVVR